MAKFTNPYKFDPKGSSGTIGASSGGFGSARLTPEEQEERRHMRELGYADSPEALEVYRTSIRLGWGGKPSKRY
jgi:hypothetical protein